MQVERHGFLGNLFVGAGSAAIAKAAAAPIERSKLLIATVDPVWLEKFRVEDPAKYKKYARPSVLPLMGRVIKEEGLLSLWRGYTVNTLHYAPTIALNFAFYGLYKHYLSATDSYLKSALAGGMAGVTSLLLLFPRDLRRLQLAHEMKSRGSMEQLKPVFTWPEGAKSALSLGVPGIFIYRGIYFGGYNYLKSILGVDHFIPSFFIAWVTTTGAALSSYPLDALRRQTQINSKATLREIYQKYGWKYFFASQQISSTASRSVSAALVISLYDVFQKYLK